MLVNLPVFNRHGGQEVWPQWLIQKSYFPEGLLFFEICREALGVRRYPGKMSRTFHFRRPPQDRERGGAEGSAPAQAGPGLGQPGRGGNFRVKEA